MALALALALPCALAFAFALLIALTDSWGKRAKTRTSTLLRSPFKKNLQWIRTWPEALAPLALPLPMSEAGEVERLGVLSFF